MIQPQIDMLLQYFGKEVDELPGRLADQEAVIRP